MKHPILVTGCAGFIGFHLCRRLLAEGHRVVGVDNLNSYYDPDLKRDRLALITSAGLEFQQLDLAHKEASEHLFAGQRFARVVHLAAQAGVRYSLTNPHAYTSANIEGFLNILEGCRHQATPHLIYASSSSVYGANRELPFVSQRTDQPLSLYAATKKANELMAHSYAAMYGLPVTGLRFFTVYGPWGRPDMALYLFAKAVLRGETLDLFNGGDMLRDFTYVYDVVESIVRLLERPPAAGAAHLFNVGNSSPVRLKTFLELIERHLGKQARVRSLPMQPGDVLSTSADASDLEEYVGFRPATPLEVGIQQSLNWYLGYRERSSYAGKSA